MTLRVSISNFIKVMFLKVFDSIYFLNGCPFQKEIFHSFQLKTLPNRETPIRPTEFLRGFEKDGNMSQESVGVDVDDSKLKSES